MAVAAAVGAGAGEGSEVKRLLRKLLIHFPSSHPKGTVEVLLRGGPPSGSQKSAWPNSVQGFFQASSIILHWKHIHMYIPTFCIL